MRLNYLVIDLETYGHTKYKRFCNPLYSGHYVVAFAYKFRGEAAQCPSNYSGMDIGTLFDGIDLDNVDVIVGQNFKFDMLWFWSNTKFRNWLKGGGRIWDTLQAEYLLRGQQTDRFKGNNKMDLDSLSKQYGAQLKNKEVTNVFADGGTVLDIDEEALVEYAKGDVDNTALVFEGQLKKAHKEGQLRIIQAYNDHLLAVTEMEYNGVYVDKEYANVLLSTYSAELEELDSSINRLVDKMNVWPSKLGPFNSGSTAQLSTLLFGGTVKVTEDEAVKDDAGQEVRYKTGKRAGEIKTRKVNVEYEVRGLGVPQKDKYKTPSGACGTGDDVLKDLLSSVNGDAQELIGLVLKKRNHSKVISTYLYNKKGKTESGYLSLLHEDGCLHSSYETIFTETGRLSSRNPNMQNMPPSILEMFRSRYGKDGVIVEMDFSQLEVVVQAYITGSEIMKQDIANKVDFHCLRLSYAEGMDYDKVVELCSTEDTWKNKRKKAKVVSFQKAYGAHSSKIAVSAGLKEATVEEIFRKEDERYPEISAFYDDVLGTLESNKYGLDMKQEVRQTNGKYAPHPTKSQAAGQWQSITGKKYTFYKKAVMTRRNTLFSYWPMPNVMNYPIQGTAADIVGMQVARIFRLMLQKPEYGVMINEIHDSIILDLKKDTLEQAIKEISTVMKDVAGGFDKYLGVKFDCDIDVDVGYGDTWKEAKGL